MFRYVVPVDDKPHSFHMARDALVVRVGNGANTPYEVEFWAEDDDSAVGRHERQFQAFGTGQPLPDGARHAGTASRTAEGLVWHLYEVTQ